jgi:hypothetical protein
MFHADEGYEYCARECLTLAKWETVSGQFGGYLKTRLSTLALLRTELVDKLY